MSSCPPPAPAVSSPSSGTAPSRPRVLVVDDDPEMRRLVCETLRKDGYDVVEDINGGRFLVRVAGAYAQSGATERLDLIVTDIRMPVCSGLDIVKGLRDAHWATPVVIMTAFADEEVTRRARQLGAVLFNKPFQMADLRRTVKSLLAPAEPAVAASDARDA